MRIGLQLLFGYLLVAVLACYLIFIFLLQGIKPIVQNETEEVLSDTSLLLAKIIEQKLTTLGEIETSTFTRGIKHINRFPIQKIIEGILERNIAYRVYIADKQGIILFDSNDQDEGVNYSNWEDVNLTLQGKYGSRITNVNPNDANSNVMYVAAPIKLNNEIVGVLTVSKSIQAISMVVSKVEQRLLFGGVILILFALIVGVTVAVRINRSVHKLVNYANKLAHHEEATLPNLGSLELKTLAKALEEMRRKLDGKDYIEKYIHTLAHELKSPLSSIRAATGILQDSSNNHVLTETDWVKTQETQQRFLTNIDRQTERMNVLIERMLQLARLESRAGLNFESINMQDLIKQVVANRVIEAESLGIQILIHQNDLISINGDKFLLTQAVNNLLSNALDFTPQDGKIEIIATVTDENYQILVQDTGTGIPEYAIERIYERFYSLARPNKGKSSGLGLAFIKEVMIVHHGEILVKNRTDIQGTSVTLIFNLNQKLS